LNQGYLLLQTKNILLIAAALAVVIGVVVFRLNQEPAADPVATQGQSPKIKTPLPSGSVNSTDWDGPIPQTEGAPPPQFFGKDPLPLNMQGPPFERQANGNILKKDVANMLTDLNDPNQDPVEDIQILNSAVGAYRRIFRENPIAGENREVVEALTGKNPYQLMLIDPSHPAINADGELVDRWKVPYRFHPISRDHMEIQSAGQDKQFGTGDDVMVEEPVEFGNSTNSEEGEG
tara:strand:+ start:386 stop:1084 length:699 start_codon:yes stop_codon:yes gene_type:complete